MKVIYFFLFTLFFSIILGQSFYSGNPSVSFTFPDLILQKINQIAQIKFSDKINGLKNEKIDMH